MDVEWDPEKAATNARKHGIDFAAAATVLFDPLGATVAQERADEERYATVSRDLFGRVLAVIHSWSEERIRLISARRATRAERRAYEGE